MALGATRVGAAAPAGIALASRGTFAATSVSQFAVMPKRAMALRGGAPAKEGDAVPEVTFKCRVRDEKVCPCPYHTHTHTHKMVPCIRAHFLIFARFQMQIGADRWRQPLRLEGRD
jgi:hypothetical protein